jgi:putative DNA primase/helicase
MKNSTTMLPQNDGRFNHTKIEDHRNGRGGAPGPRPIDRVLDAVGYDGQRNGKHFKALCPAHDDRNPSLSVTEAANGKVLINCFGGCSLESVLGAMGLQKSDLFPDDPTRRNGHSERKPKAKRHIDKTYDYRDEEGKLLYQVVRYKPKDFKQRQPDGKGGWIWSLTDPPVRRILYRLPELRAADPTAWTFIVEGEKDVDNSAPLGIVATTNAGGAEKWEEHFNQEFRGRRACILPDNDEKGRKHAAKIAAQLLSVAATVRVLALDGLPEKGDISDWLAMGHTAEELIRLVEAAPNYVAPALVYANHNGAGPHAEEVPALHFFDTPHNTDMGNAMRMYARVKDRVMYVKEFDRWHVWTGTHWQADSNFTVLALAKETVRAMYAELADIANDEKRKEQLKWIIQSESRARLESMIALLRSEPGITVEAKALDRHPMLLPCKNGTIDLATGDLLPSDPAHRATICLDIEYDPSADCPLWEKFLIRIMGSNLELVSFIQRLVGHALTGDASGKYLVFMWGEKGNNGKSTLVETVMRLLGGYAMKSPTEMVMAKSYRGGVPNDIARLRGVRFTVTNEVDEGMTLSESVIKDLTGKDTLSARFMRGEFFDFEPTHKLWIYGNHKPEIRGTDPAIWERVRLIPFEVEIPKEERDERLQEKLACELPGILAWAVRGCLQWQRVGINAPEIVNLATSEYRAEQDMLAQFLDDCCDTGKSYDVGASTIYQAYESWCKEMGIKPDTGTKFGRELTRRGFVADRTSKGKTRRGIQLNTYGRSLLPTPTPHWSDER